MKVTVLGRHGFIGSALTKELEQEGWEVTSFPTKDVQCIFHFASPVHPPFEENPDYHMQEVLNSFMHLLPFCRDNNIKFVYASSALVYEDRDMAFIKTKKIMELMASMYPNTLGLRIFPVYGPGENRTAISQFCEDMKNDRRPKVYGDGNQERDFIFIDDVIFQIMEAIENNKTGIIDIGAGYPVSFNLIIHTINTILGKDIKPLYQDKPKDYAKGIVCKNPGTINFSIYEGITRILEQ